MRVRLLMCSIACALASCSLVIDTSGLSGGATDADGGGGPDGGGLDGSPDGPCAAACDDHDPCTDDTCTATGQCVHTAGTAACDDGDPCTKADACKLGTCFSGAVDTVSATCTSKPTPIYRSVGPSSVDALATSTASSSTMTLAGTTVLFSKALPDRIGVGDALQYDSDGDGKIDALAFIHARLSSTTYRVRAHDGKSPVAVANGTMWSLYRAYTSLDDATSTGNENVGIDGTLRNFDTWSGGHRLDTEQWNIACYADGIPDSTPVTLCNAAYTTPDCPAKGWITSPTSYLRIYTPTSPSEVGTSQRHKGRWGEGYQRTGYIIVQPGGYVRIDGMSIRQTSTDRTYLVLAPGIGGEIQITNSFGWSVQRTFDVWDGDYAPGGTMHVVKFFNDIGVTDSTTDPAGAFYLNSSKIAAYVYNSTGIARAPSSGAFNGVYGVGVCKNCLGVQVGSAGGFIGSWVSVSTSASNDGSAMTFGANNVSNQVFSFVDSASNDYHLVKSSSSNGGVRGKGENLSTSFTTDIDGDARPAMGGWDIGADQVVP